MHVLTYNLAVTVRNLPTLAEKVATLKDAYTGEDCWIIATGPSAVEIPKETLQSALADKLVITVKQAYELLPDRVDFQVINPCHLPKYEYGPDLPIRVAVIWPPGSAEWDRRWDLSFRIPRCGVMNGSVCWTKDFAKWELAKSIDRPWGPGIMHEIGIYLPVHFGCKRIFTLGFDMEPRIGRHFWAPGELTMDRDTVTVPVKATTAMREWLDSHNIEWYRIATRIGSQLPSPTISFEEALK